MKDIIKDVRVGKFVIIIDDSERENEGDLFAAAELVTPEHINFMVTNGRGLICMPITAKKAELLNIKPMIPNTQNTEKERCKFGISIDAKQGTTTGVSAFDRAVTIRKAVLSSNPDDFRRPGHMFPLLAEENGVFARQGHTEAAVDLAKIAGLNPIGVICEIMNEDGTMANGKEIYEFAEKHHIKTITIAEIIKHRVKNEKLIEKVIDINLPTAYGDFKVYAFKNKITGSEDIALVKGEIKKEMLVRIHSECMTSEVFKSLKCDCEEQLNASMKLVQRNGGIIIYLRQEGRGIGLISKLKAYKLQEKGYDTIDANEKLGFKADLRDYWIAAQILKYFNVNSVDLLTNNPEKVRQLEEYGVKVNALLPLESIPSKHNFGYLKTKKEKLGHMMNVKEKLTFI